MQSIYKITFIGIGIAAAIGLAAAKVMSASAAEIVLEIPAPTVKTSFAVVPHYDGTAAAYVSPHRAEKAPNKGD